MHPTKQSLCDALRTFVNQRPGFEAANYMPGSSWDALRAYRADARRATQQRADALAMLAYVEARDGIAAEAIVEAARGGRLRIYQQGGLATIDYCVGQYWCVEYRAGVCRVLASAIWNYLRDDESTGDSLRASCRRIFGRGIASRWFA